jgi:hypothetical protein
MKGDVGKSMGTQVTRGKPTFHEQKPKEKREKKEEGS